MGFGDGQAWQALGDPAAALAALDPAGRREAALRAALAAEIGLPLEGACMLNQGSACGLSIRPVSAPKRPKSEGKQLMRLMSTVHAHSQYSHSIRPLL